MDNSTRIAGIPPRRSALRGLTLAHTPAVPGAATRVRGYDTPVTAAVMTRLSSGRCVTRDIAGL